MFQAKVSVARRSNASSRVYEELRGDVVLCVGAMLSVMRGLGDDVGVWHGRAFPTIRLYSNMSLWELDGYRDVYQ